MCFSKYNAQQMPHSRLFFSKFSPSPWGFGQNFQHGKNKKYANFVILAYKFWSVNCVLSANGFMFSKKFTMPQNIVIEFQFSGSLVYFPALAYQV